MGKKKTSDNAGEPSKWGKGKTDPETWFQPGCKPGPGRPKGSKNRGKLWVELSAEQITVSNNGKPFKASKGALKYHQVINKAASGDHKAIQLAIQLDDRYLPAEQAAPTPQQTQADLSTLDALIALRTRFAKPESGAA